ncbi:ProQ/FinO family protein (plasmid) [Cupriavidus necator]|nr:ProQ/FinO family protein [Cupriavidus necator]
MGFEQLAALRAQLASAKAAAEPALSVGAVIGRLQQRFPEAFPRKPAPKLPLKVGILAAPAGALGLTEDHLRAALGAWCRGQRYWAGLAAGASRVDLTGAAAGTVTEQEAAWAHQQASRHMRPEGARKMPARNGDAPASDAG